MTALNHNKNSEKWELKLGIAQTIMFLGLVLGTVTLSFVLGYFAGRTAGIKLAMERTATSQTKIPITSDPTDQSQGEISDQVVDEVYDRLRDKAAHDASPAPVPSNDVPALGAIQESENKIDPLPEVGSTVEAQPSQKPSKDLKEIQEVWDIPEKAEKHDKAEQPTAVAASKVVPTVEGTIRPQATSTPIKPTPSVAPTLAPAKTVISALAKEKEKAQVGTADGAKVVRGVIPPGWYAQVAAPSSNSDAESLSSQLRSNGFHVVIENASVRGEVYYRILVGPEANRNQAEVLVDQLKRETYIKSEPFIKMVR